MANWTGVITNAGNVVLNEWANEKTLTMDRAAAGQGTVSAAGLLAQMALVSQRQEAHLLGGEKDSNGIRLKLRFPAADNAYTLNQIGVWASVTGGESTMIALFQHEQGIPIPSQAESPDFLYTFYGLISCSNTGEWNVTVDTSVAATVGDLEQAKTDSVAEALEQITTSPEAEELTDSDAFATVTATGIKRTPLSLLKQVFGKLFAAKPEKVTAGNLPVLTAEGQLEDSGLTPSMAGVRPNLLDNWYFVGQGTVGKLPINQLGVTSSDDVASNAIFIDRWRIGALGGSVSVTVNGLVYSDTTGANIFQKISVPAYLFGQTVTLSAWMQGKLVSGTATIPTATAWPTETTILKAYSDSDIGLELFVLTENGEKIVEFAVILKTALTLKAVKMEIGSSQTLCIPTSASSFALLDIPEYATELAKCQRHMIVFKSTKNRPYWAVTNAYAATATLAIANVVVPVSMRTTPAAQVVGSYQLTGGGTVFSVSSIKVTNGNDVNVVTLDIASPGSMQVGDSFSLRADNDPDAYILLNANL